jgi:hypothetical protein
MIKESVQNLVKFCKKQGYFFTFSKKKKKKKRALYHTILLYIKSLQLKKDFIFKI